MAYLLLGTVVTIVFGLALMRLRLHQDPNRRQTIGETIYELAQNEIAGQGLPTKATGRWFPYVASLFLFVLVVNFIGFIPLPLTGETFELFGLELPTLGIYAATSALSVTLALALMTFFFTHVEGVRWNGPGSTSRAGYRAGCRSSASSGRSAGAPLPARGDQPADAGRRRSASVSTPTCSPVTC